MKLKDWDEEEEKVPQRDRVSMAEPDFDDTEDGDLEELDMEDGRPYRDLGDSGTDFHEAPEKRRGSAGLKRNGDMSRESLPGQGLRKRPGRSGREPEQEEELAPLPTWAKALIFVGLAVLAAIICAVLWRFVHPDKPEEKQGSLAGNIEASGDRSDLPGDLPSGAESESGESAEPGAASESDRNPQTSAEPGQDTADPGAASGGEAPDGIPEDSEAQESPQPEAPDTQPESSGTQSEPSGPAAGSQPGSDTETKEPPAGNGAMTFTAVQESVTPKDAVNLRTAPTTADEGNIVVKIQNGETLNRIGMNTDTGWSQINYNGQTLYAVSQYLTTDLNYKTPVTPSDPNRVVTAGGSVVIFENCDDWISPKEYVNLRTEPSTVQDNATVSCQLQYGEKAHRTGYSEDFGWSRVEYNGQVLYVVTSFVYVVPAE